MTEAKLTLDRTGLHINSDEVAKALAKKNISPSLITGVEVCPAKWVAESFVIRDLIEEDKDNPGTRGSLFHMVMELFFAHPPAERTPELVKTKVKEALAQPDFQHFATNKDAIDWLRGAINGYYNMGGDPTKVEIAKINTPKGDRSGLELFVKGKLGDTERNILGFVDRVIVDPRDSSKVIIEDWKSGAKAKKWNGKITSNEGMAEQRQQMIYTMLLEEQGYDVSLARLIYPVPREIVNVQTKNDDLRKKVVSDIENTDKSLAHMTEQNTFDCTPSFLCSFCPISQICPVADLKPYGKLKTAAAEQPRAEDLYPVIQGV